MEVIAGKIICTQGTVEDLQGQARGCREGCSHRIHAVVGDPMVPAAAFRSPTEADTMKRSTGGALDAFSMS